MAQGIYSQGCVHAVQVLMLLLSQESNDIITDLIYVVLFATAADTHRLTFLLLQYISPGRSQERELFT